MSDTDLSSGVLPISIVDEMHESYLDYAMSVIVSRAIPDICDGLKPVHRRILYSMYSTNCYYNSPYRKSARIVGDVMGKYHPHGDSAIYQSLVRMAQGFNMRVPLIDGQGNFGSIDGDNAAAMRYTESRMSKVSHSILADIEMDTVDFQENYDGSEIEPKVLPSRYPNLLVNGAGGIAVGMATNIPPYNLGEVIDACLLCLKNNYENKETTIDEIFEIVKGPDFPTGGIILGYKGSYDALSTGRGSIVMSSKASIVESGSRSAIVINEIPYQVNKAHTLERIGELVRDKKIEGISEIRDESDKDGIRVVIDIKRGFNADIILNQLYKFTQLRLNFSVNMLALDRGVPRSVNFKDVIIAFLKFRTEVVRRRTAHLLGKARDKAHILIGLSIAVANIDEVIHIIRSSKDPSEAKEVLLSKSWPIEDMKSLIGLVEDEKNIVLEDNKCFFTEAQVRGILEIKLAKLTGLEQKNLQAEIQVLSEKIKDYLDILGSEERVVSIIKEELLGVKEEFATPRKTQFDENEFETDIEDLIPKEDMVVTVTMGGYIKRVPLSVYKAQKRGGKGKFGLSMHDEDYTIKVFVINTHTPVLFFSTFGKVYKMKTYKLPLGSSKSKGRALVNIFPLSEGETINVIMPLPDNEEDWKDKSIVFSTLNGMVRRNDLLDFKNVQSNGKIAMKLENEEDRLVSVRICHPSQHIMLSTKMGKCIRFPSKAIREFKSRSSVGVRGIKLEKGNKVTSMTVLNNFRDIDKCSRYLKIDNDQRIALCQCLKIQQSFADDKLVLDKVGEKINNLLESIESDLSRDDILELAKNEQFILTITEAGYGKRSSAYEYRVTNRGGSGFLNISPKSSGLVVSSYIINEMDQVIVVTDSGKMIRTLVSDIRVTGRNTKGVIIFRTNDKQKVISAARIADDIESDKIFSFIGLEELVKEEEIEEDDSFTGIDIEEVDQKDKEIPE